MKTRIPFASQYGGGRLSGLGVAVDPVAYVQENSGNPLAIYQMAQAGHMTAEQLAAATQRPLWWIQIMLMLGAHNVSDYASHVANLMAVARTRLNDPSQVFYAMQMGDTPDSAIVQWAAEIFKIEPDISAPYLAAGKSGVRDWHTYSNGAPTILHNLGNMEELYYSDSSVAQQIRTSTAMDDATRAGVPNQWRDLYNAQSPSLPYTAAPSPPVPAPEPARSHMNTIDNPYAAVVAQNTSSAVSQVSDTDIHYFVAANLNNPKLVYEKKLAFNLTDDRIAAATGYSLAEVAQYMLYGRAGVTDYAAYKAQYGNAVPGTNAPSPAPAPAPAPAGPVTVTDQTIRDFINANQNNPKLVYDKAREFNLTVQRISTATGLSVAQVTTYLQLGAQGITDFAAYQTTHSPTPHIPIPTPNNGGIIPIPMPNNGGIIPLPTSSGFLNEKTLLIGGTAVLALLVLRR